MTGFAEAPVLETERLLLRPHRLTDFEAYVGMWADPVVTRFIGGRPRDREESWVRFVRHAGMWSLIGYGFWAFEDRKSGRLVGEGGFHEIRRLIEPSIEGVPESGWALLPDVHGQGYGLEAMQRVLEWGDRHFDGPRSVCIIDPDNLASLRLARKCGYVEYARTDYHDHATILLQRFAQQR